MGAHDLVHWGAERLQESGQDRVVQLVELWSRLLKIPEQGAMPSHPALIFVLLFFLLVVEIGMPICAHFPILQEKPHGNQAWKAAGLKQRGDRARVGLDESPMMSASALIENEKSLIDRFMRQSQLS